jgi:hypothetical protein
LQIGAEIRKRRLVINPSTKRRTAPARYGDSLMRTLSFILAFTVVLAGPLMSGTSDNGLPGVGTFSYIGSPVVTDAAPVMVVAAR